jgi:hypothetical protein
MHFLLAAVVRMIEGHSPRFASARDRRGRSTVATARLGKADQPCQKPQQHGNRTEGGNNGNCDVKQQPIVFGTLKAMFAHLLLYR